jgi:hypothetical protein
MDTHDELSIPHGVEAVVEVACENENIQALSATVQGMSSSCESPLGVRATSYPGCDGEITISSRGIRSAILVLLTIAALALIWLLVILTCLMMDEDPSQWMGNGWFALTVLATFLTGGLWAAVQVQDGAPHNHYRSCADRLFHTALALIVSRAAQTLLILLILAILALWFSLYLASVGVTTYNPDVYGIPVAFAVMSSREVRHHHDRVTVTY